jgi:hypothetical protein
MENTNKKHHTYGNLNGINYFDGLINRLEDDEIFVFGSNTEGIHGAGAAKKALDFGAIVRKAEGISGQTYAIPTVIAVEVPEVRNKYFKDSRVYYVNRPLRGDQKMDKALIQKHIEKFFNYARENSGFKFLFTDIGTGFAGFTYREIVEILPSSKDIPENVFLSKKMVEELFAFEQENELKQAEK